MAKSPLGLFAGRDLKEKRKKQRRGYSYSKNMANFEAFHYLGHFIKHKPLISEECA